MKGMSEEYTKNSPSQGNVAKELWRRLEEHVLSELLASEESLLTILECGSGPGTSSEFVLLPLLEAMQRHNPSLHAMAYFEDLPSNPWHQLFEGIPSLLEKKGINSERVFTAGIGKSFYERLLPPSSVHFVYSSTAMHWLPSEAYNSLPVSYRSKQLFASGADMSDADYQTVTQFARSCWAQCLRYRATELKQGGYFALVMPSDRRSDQDSMAPEFSESFPFDSIPEDLHDQLTSPAWGMSNETVDVFFRGAEGGRGDLDLSPLYQVVYQEEIRPGCPFTRMFEVNRDIESVSDLIFSAIQAVIGPYVRSVLSSRLCEQEISQIIEKWRRTWNSQVRGLGDPSKLKMNVAYQLLILRKK